MQKNQNKLVAFLILSMTFISTNANAYYGFNFQAWLQSYLRNLHSANYVAKADVEKKLNEAEERLKDVKALRSRMEGLIPSAKKLKITVSGSTKREIQSIINGLRSRETSLFSQLVKFKNMNLSRVSGSSYNSLKNSVINANTFKSHAERLIAKFDSNKKVLTTKIDALNDQFLVYIEDILNCRRAGQVDDSRAKDRQYHCNEIPFGDTSVFGLTYDKYLTDYKKYNNERNHRVIQRVPRKMRIGRWYRKLNVQQRCTYLSHRVVNRRRSKYYTSDYYQRCLNHKLSYSQFKRAFAKEFKNWRDNKRVANIPIQYRDKKRTRKYNVKIDGKRQLSTSFKIYNDAIKLDGDVAYAKSCFQIPGTEIYSIRQKLKYTWAKGWWGSISETAKLTLPGMKFTNVTTCALLKISPKSGNKVQLLSMLSPRFNGLKLTPFKIRVSGGILGKLTKAFKFISFGLFDIEKIASKYVNRYLNKNFTRDFKSGKFFVKYLQTYIGQNLSMTNNNVVTTSTHTHNSRASRSFASASGKSEQLSLKSRELRTKVDKFLGRNGLTDKF